MRIFTALFALAFFIQACDLTAPNYWPYNLDETDRMTAAPFSIVDKPLDVYFAGESVPDRAYVRIKLLREVMSYRPGTPDALLNRLLERSRQLGADGFIVLGQDNITSQYSDSDGWVRSRTDTEMWGMAIRHTDSIAYNDRALRHLEVVPLDNQTDGGIIKVLDDGQLMAEPANAATRFVRNYSLEYLLDSRHPWKYAYSKQQPVVVDRPSLRMIENSGFKMAKVEIQNYVNGKVLSFRVAIMDGVRKNQTVRLLYDTDMNLVERQWQQDAKVAYRVTRHYDTEGRVAYEAYIRTENKREPETVFRVNYHYHTAESFEAQYKDAKVINPANQQGE